MPRASNETSPSGCVAMTFQRQSSAPRSPGGPVEKEDAMGCCLLLQYLIQSCGQKCRYGEAPSPAASCRAHDGSRQRGTACPLLYRYRLTHTYFSLARLPMMLSFICSFRNKNPYSPFRRRAHPPTAFSGPMARPPPSPPRPLPSHMHAGWMVSATKTPTSSAPSQDPPF